MRRAASLARGMVATVFLASALAKAGDFAATADYVASLAGATVVAGQLLVAALVLLEIVTATAVLFWLDDPFWRRASLAVGGSFLFVSIGLLLTGAENCACFGTRIVLTPTQTIVKNVVLVALLGIAIIGTPRGTSRFPREVTA